MSQLQGLALARHLAENREVRPRQLKEEGKTVMGCLCCFAPPEIMHAAGVVPYRITGRPGESTSEVDGYLEPFGCPYVRSVFAQSFKGSLDFLDGLVISHSCDMVQRLYGIWTYYRPCSYNRMINVPHQLFPWSRDFYYRELVFFKESLEEFMQVKITPGEIKASIELYNRIRALIRKLNSLRGGESPKLLSSELMEVLLAGEVLPPEEFLPLLQEVVQEVEARQSLAGYDSRVMVWGSILDHPMFYRIIEEAGGQVVADDTCLGARFWNEDVLLTEDPVEGLVQHYLLDFQCPRTDRGAGEERFEYLRERAEEYGVDGVIGYIISFCDPHKFDYPDLRDYLKKQGLPMLLIEDNYSFQSAGAISTRLQAFLEMLPGKSC